MYIYICVCVYSHTISLLIYGRICAHEIQTIISLMKVVNYSATSFPEKNPHRKKLQLRHVAGSHRQSQTSDPGRCEASESRHPKLFLGAMVMPQIRDIVT